MLHHLADLILTQGQTVPASPTIYPPVFPQMFPNPSGTNGYEEIVQAGDTVRNNTIINAAQFAEATLTQKRAALAEIDAVRGLSLLRRGFQKPIEPPQQDINPGTLFPELAMIRNLARLLSIEQYVLFADGKTGLAVSNLRDGIALGSAPIPTSLIGALVGVAVYAITMTGFAQHLDQLSARDCDRLLEFARETLNAPSPFPVALESEHRRMLSNLQDNFEGYLSGFFSADSDNDAEDARMAKLNADLSALKNDPAARQRLMMEVSERVNRHFATLNQRLQNPAALLPEQLPPDNTLAGRLMDAILVPTHGVTDRIATSRILIQLLGVHGAIRRYRWEHNALPDNLTLLRLKELEIDPFSGQPLRYQKNTAADTNFMTNYTLSSVGATDSDARGKPTIQRNPITLPPTPRKG